VCVIDGSIANIGKMRTLSSLKLLSLIQLAYLNLIMVYFTMRVK